MGDSFPKVTTDKNVAATGKRGSKRERSKKRSRTVVEQLFPASDEKSDTTQIINKSVNTE